MRAFLVAIALVFASASAAEQVRTVAPAKPAPNNERRVALVIGNSAYKTSPLRNPVNDARAMAQALSETGFAVTLVEDGSQAAMRRAVREFGNELLKGGTGLFYYAGHGMQVRGKNYLIPVNADIQAEDEVEDQGVDVGFVMAKMDTAKNALNIMILDACRNNPFQRSFRSASQGLAQMDAPTGTLISFATAPGSVAADGAGENGLYTSHLLRAIRTPGLPIEQLFKQVRIGVTKDTGDKQVPWESSSLRGDFFFLLPSPGFQAEEQKRQQQYAIDKAVGDAVRQSEERAAKERAELQGQMQKLIAEMLAKQRAELDAERKARGETPVASAPPPAPVAAPKPPAGDAPQMELAFWESIKGSRDPADFRAYLERYPQGTFAALARNRASAPAAAAQAPAPPSPPPAAPPVPASAQVASIAPTPAARPRGMPAVGDRWTYRWRNLSRDLPPGTSRVEVKLAGPEGVLEEFVPVTGATQVRAFGPELTIAGPGFPAFQPYMLAFRELKKGDSWDVPHQRLGPCSGASNFSCRVVAEVLGRESVTVPAGTFDAWKVEVTIVYRPNIGVTAVSTDVITFWYAEAARREVKVSRRAFGTRADNSEIELESYQLN